MFIFITMLLIISLLAYALALKLELHPIIIKSNGLVGTLRITYREKTVWKRIS
jgi:hypothetical protein